MVDRGVSVSRHRASLKLTDIVQTGDLANLYENGLASEDANADGAVNWWTSRGAPDAKVVMGLPLYGRGFESTAGLGKPFSGVRPTVV